MQHFLDFEQPIADLEAKIDELRRISPENLVDLEDELGRLEAKCKKLTREIFKDLTAWQVVQLARHPSRPYSLDYIHRLFTEFIELHGDRMYADDGAVVAGLARLSGRGVVVIGHQKGRDTNEKIARNFGMPRPEGFRKAQRVMKLAQRYGLPVVTFIDTPGAYPGIDAEERGQSEAIASSISLMADLKVPIISVVIGEGASGGALAIGLSDRILCLKNTWYSVISPESCSSILWRSWEYKEAAASALKLTAKDMKKMKLVDEIIKEPLGGAHRNREKTFMIVRKSILNSYDEFKNMSSSELVRKRMKKYSNMGIYKS